MASSDTHQNAQRPSRRTRRSDGDATRARILEQAGLLFAEKGYADTTGKEIAFAAGVDLAAISYHFGGRGELYGAVLREAHGRIMALADLLELAGRPDDPRDKLRAFYERLVGHLISDQEWHVSLWARALLSPTDHLSLLIEEEVLPKLDAILGIFSEITAIPKSDPVLLRSAVSAMAPCLVLLLLGRTKSSPAQAVLRLPPQDLVDHLLRFTLGGLEAVRLTYKRQTFPENQSSNEASPTVSSSACLS